MFDSRNYTPGYFLASLKDREDWIDAGISNSKGSFNLYYDTARELVWYVGDCCLVCYDNIVDAVDSRLGIRDRESVPVLFAMHWQQQKNYTPQNKGGFTDNTSPVYSHTQEVL